MKKLSAQVDQGVDETVQAASSSGSRKKLPQYLSMNYHGHDHGDKHNQRQSIVTVPEDFGYPRQKDDGEGAAYKSFQW